jgi:hypothetical protein
MHLALVASAFALMLGAPAAALAQYGGTPQGYGSPPSGPYGQQPPQYGSGQSPSQYGQPQYGQQAGSQVQAGGLAPPASAQRDPDSWRTEQALDTAEKKDSGRGLEWFWVNVEGGVQHVGLQTFKSDGIVDPSRVSTTQTGPLLGAGLGVRLVFITLGPRFRYAAFERYALWTLDAEAGLRIPIGRLEPYAVLGAGYASVGSFSGDLGGVSAGDLSIRGAHVRAGGGLDYYVTPVFSVGANVSFDFLALSRSSVSADKLEDAQSVYAADGSGIGAGFSGTAVVGLHF